VEAFQNRIFSSRLSILPVFFFLPVNDL
jgi:hypothetical protein